MIHLLTLRVGERVCCSSHQKKIPHFVLLVVGTSLDVGLVICAGSGTVCFLFLSWSYFAAYLSPICDGVLGG